MPFYDYFCEANQKTVEVFHGSSERFKTWGEVCERAKIDLEGTPVGAAVVRMLAEVNPMIFRVKGLDKHQPSKKLLV